MSLESLDPAPHKSLREVATSTLRRAILSGDLKPGERLLESAIAQQIGISRAPVREALRQLEMEGLVVSEPHRGTFVVELSLADLWEIYTLRAAIVRLAAELVTESARAEALPELKRAVDEMEQATRQGDRACLAALDQSFQEMLCRAANHSRLLNVWLSTTDQLRTQIDLADSLYLPPKDVVARHTAAIEHIESGRARQAGETLARHILKIGERIRQDQIQATDTPHASHPQEECHEP